jgi:hypothetical protein
MLPEEIEQVIAGFAATANRVVQAGLAGVEINAGQWSLIRQFLSALSNFRQDEFGGDPQRRMRFLLEVTRRVREVLGPGPVLGIKLCGDELAPWGGLTAQDSAAIAVRLAASGAVDYLSIEIGGPYSTHVTDAGMPTPQGHAAHLAAGIRAALRSTGHNLPVFADGRIEAESVATRILAEQQADAVVMTRALLSDPLLPRKIAIQHGLSTDEVSQSLDGEPVRPHVGNLRYYSVRGDWNRPVGDLANPRAGREASLPFPERLPEAQVRPVLVVGGGPAGCEAAATLARQSWAVTLVEGKDQLGGWARHLANTVATRAEFGPLAEFYAQWLQRLGVNVQLGTPLSGAEAQVAGRALADYDRVYIATGAEAPPSDLILEAPACPVVTVRDLLAWPAAPLPTAGHVAVVDTEYGFRMANAVEVLLARGHTVDVVSPDFFVGRELVESGDFFWFQRVAGAQVNGAPAVTLRPRLKAKALLGHALVCADRFSAVETRIGPLAMVVLAQPEVPSIALYDALRVRHPAVVRVGDARAPRLMGEAILNAHRAVVLRQTS